jgi:hypothetical protein
MLRLTTHFVPYVGVHELINNKVTISMEQSPSKTNTRAGDQEIRSLLCKLNVHLNGQNNKPCVLRHLNQVHNHTPSFFNISVNAILPFAPAYFK